MSDLSLSAKAIQVCEILKERYPHAECALLYEGDPFRLFVMARLSAQCTDARVNLVAPALFRRFPDAAAMAEADLFELEDLIRSCGLYKTKAASLKAASEQIVLRHGGKIPTTQEELLALPGVGRKIANLLLGDLFGTPGVVADTHCIRISARLGFTKPGEHDPLRTELALREIIPKAEQTAFCHRIVLFGRDVCTARTPACDDCPMRKKGICNGLSDPKRA